MFFLAGVADESEVEEAVSWVYLVDYDVVGVVAVFSGADLDLLDVAQAGVLGALADGEDAVEEVVELLGAGEVILGDGVAHVALWGVGYDEEGPAVFLFQRHEFHHEETGYIAFFGGVAEVGEVVDDDDAGSDCQCGGFDVGEEVFFVVLGPYGFGDYLCAEEVLGEEVPGAGFGVEVAELELFVGEFAVYVEDFLVPGYLVGHLDGEDGLAEVGVGEEAAYFALVPEAVVEVAGVGTGGGVEYGPVGGLDAEHADKAGAGDLLDLAVDGFYGVEVLRCRSPGAVAIFHT